MTKYYTDEKNALILIALFKQHRIRKAIVSPGTTNMPVVVSLQNDPYFQVYSTVDERSAAYMACGLAAESGEPVIISCTGATASRNYLPGLTEAYYRKLPVVAVTATQAVSKIGHHIPQVIDRSSLLKDVAKVSVTLPVIKDDEDIWDCEIKINKALLELKRHGGGPVHINISVSYNQNYNTRELPLVRVINRVTTMDKFPDLPSGNIAVFIGTHAIMTNEQMEILDRFCSMNNAVVFCDHTSNYKGKYRLLYSLAASQNIPDLKTSRPDLLIHIGEISGDYYTSKLIQCEVWRISEDGEIRDTFRRLRYIFEMTEVSFFEHYSKDKEEVDNKYYSLCKTHLTELYKKNLQLPFSNIWMASKMAQVIPEGSTIHFGILNSLRSWNFFEIPPSVSSFANVGGFGIDGALSSLIGASFTNRDKLYFGIIGDLAFFYDMNSLGNRHINNNIRILLVNNGKGTEFRQYNHVAAQFGEDADQYIAAAGHFGNKSPLLVKHLAQDLGFEYMSSGNKEEFEGVYRKFLTPSITPKPLLLEAFTNNYDESEALKIMMNIKGDSKEKTKQLMKQLLEENKEFLKRIIKQ